MSRELFREYVKIDLEKVDKKLLRYDIREVRYRKVADDNKRMISMRIPEEREKLIDEISSKVGFAKRYIRSYALFLGIKVLLDATNKLVEENGEEITEETPKEEE